METKGLKEAKEGKSKDEESRQEEMQRRRWDMQEERMETGSDGERKIADPSRLGQITTLTSLQLGSKSCILMARRMPSKSPFAAALIRAASSCSKYSGGPTAAKARRRDERVAVRNRGTQQEKGKQEYGPRTRPAPD